MTAVRLTYSSSELPSIAVQWLAHLLNFQEFPGSRPGFETGYPDLGFSWVFLISSGRSRDSTSDRFISLSINQPVFDAAVRERVCATDILVIIK